MTWLLNYFPDYSATNPFQRMLYQGCGDSDISVRPMTLRKLRHRAVDSSHDRTVVHVHWTNPIVQRHSDPLEARRSMRTFLADIDRLRDDGAVLLWTIHNALPHDHRHHLLEIELHQQLAERADIVHVLTPQTFSAVEPYYRLDPDRVMQVPHSSFIGRYPSGPSISEARATLGVAEHERVVAMVGALRPYRGASRLLDALDLLQARGESVRLLLAGRPSSSVETAELLVRAREHPSVILHDSYLDDDQMATWMRAADVAAMPYERVLNSASFGLAITFGLPVIAPRLGAFLDELDEPYVHSFSARDTEALAQAVMTALEPSTLESRKTAALDAAQRRHPDAMSRDFCAALLARLSALD